ncbi:TPA_asm: maturation protein, partial [ssRNA phage SRR7976325_17]
DFPRFRFPCNVEPQMERIVYQYGTTGRIAPWNGQLLNPTSSIVGYKKLSITDTVKRPFPSDPFASATSRTVTTERAYGGIGRYTDAGSIDLVAVRDYYPCTPSLGNLHSEPWLAEWAPLESRLRAKIKNQNVNLAVACAEYRSTCGLFASTARRIYSAARALNPGFAFGNVASLLIRDRPVVPRRASKKAVNEWLQFQYGMIPILSDLGGMAEELAGAVNEGFPMYVNLTDRLARSATGVSGDLKRDTGYRWTNYAAYSKRIRARYLVRNASLKRFTQVGLTNVAAAGWELVPYSFVLDQIIPIGAYLESLDAMVGVENLTVQRSYKTTFGPESTGRLGTHVGFFETKHRFSNQMTLSLPPLRYQPSGSYLSVVNGLALLAQIRL